jgi:large subunit ribosomal protein L22
VPETTARLRYLRTSPTKIRPVLKLITGRDVADARDALQLCDRSVATEVGKLLDSAIANAEHNDHVAEDELFVVRAFADEGPILKRWRPRARGRGVRINKRTSHITVVLARLEEDEIDRRRAREVVAPSRRRPTRRRAARPEAEHDHERDDHDHDHDHEGHDHEHDHEHEGDDEGAADAEPSTRRVKKTTAKKTAKKATKATKTTKTTEKAAPAKKAATTAKKSTKATKKSPRKGS